MLHALLPLALFSLALLALTPAPFASARTVGQLQVSVAVQELSYDKPSTMILVSNPGSVAVKHVRVHLNGPGWANASLTYPLGGRPRARSVSLGSLRAGRSVFVRLRVKLPIGGRAGTLVVRATGSGPVGAQSAVTLADAQPAASLELAGSTEVADHSPGSVTVLVHNNTDKGFDVGLRASGDGLILAGPNAKGASPPSPDWRATVSVPAHQVRAVPIVVKVATPVQPRHVALIVRATVPAGSPRPVEIVTSRDIALTLSAGGFIPSFAGIGSVLVFPGVAAVLVYLLIREWDRSRLGLVRRNVAGVLWDNKLWLVLAACISLLAIWLFARLTDIDLLATPWRWALPVLTACCAVVAGAAAAAKVGIHRLRVPLINADSDAAAVIKAAARRGERNREVYAVPPDGKGAIIHRDYDVYVLAPKTWISKPGDLTTDTTTLAAIAKALRTRPHDVVVGYQKPTPAGWIARPSAVPSTTPWTGERVKLPIYQDQAAE